MGWGTEKGRRAGVGVTGTAQFWDGADLVVEILGEGFECEKRDWVDKRADYERAGIPEYWVVDPQKALGTVFALKHRRYVVHSEGRAGQRVTSFLLAGFEVDVDAVLASGQL